MLDRAPGSGQARSETRDDAFAGDEALVLIASAVQFLFSNFLTIAAGVVLALAVMIVHLLTTTPTYTAHTQLLIDARVPSVLREASGEVGLTLDTAQVESQIAVLHSEQIALIVINKLRLLEDPAFMGASAKVEANVEEKDEAKQDPNLIRQAIGGYQEGLGVRRLGLSYVLEIAYTADDPVRAARFANATADAYVEDKLTARAQAARQGAQWLEERMEEMRNQVNQAALRVQEFKVRRDYRIRRDTGQEQGVKGDKSEAGDKPDPNETSMRTLEELEATAQTYRKIYEGYLQAYTEAVQRQSYPATNARVITRASPPTTKSSPKTLRLLLAAVVGGGLIGLAIALLRQVLTGVLGVRRAGRVS